VGSKNEQPSTTEYMSRWIELYTTTPSGKTQFVCQFCGRISPLPDKKCPQPPEVGPHKMALSCELLEEVAMALEKKPLKLSTLYVSYNETTGEGSVSWDIGTQQVQTATMRLTKV